jgi:hypothetical protein
MRLAHNPSFARHPPFILKMPYAHCMQIPHIVPDVIPSGARVVVRRKLGIGVQDGRMKFSDVIGHVVSWDGKVLIIDRDPTPDGRRAGERIEIDAPTIAALKPIPERTASTRADRTKIQHTAHTEDENCPSAN